MKEKTFCLASETNPAFRLGILGLRMACLHARNGLYPGIPDGLTWDIGQDSVTLHYENWGMLNQFMDSVWGECPRGYIIAPGHTDNEKSPGIYRTLQAHMGLMASFRKYDGGRSYDSRIIQVFKTDKEAPNSITTPFMEKIGNIVKYVKDDKEVIEEWFVSSPCIRTEFSKTVTAKGGATSVSVISRKPVSCKTNASFLYPGLAKWNNTPVSLDEMGTFLISFAGLAFIHNEGQEQAVFSIGLDADTFEEFDQWFAQWLASPIIRYIKADSDKAVASMMASLAGLPEGRTYPIMQKSADDPMGVVNFFTYSPTRRKLVDILLKAGVDPVDAHGLLKEMVQAPLHKKKAPKVSMYDKVLANVEAGIPWYAGFDILPETKDVFDSGYLPERVRKLLTDLSDLMETDRMERALQEKMRACVISIAKAKGSEGKPAYNKAEDLVTKVYLRRIKTRTSLLDTVSKICVLAGVHLADDEIEYLKHMHPDWARSCLTLGAMKHKSSGTSDTTEKTSSEDTSYGDRDPNALNEEGETENENA